MIKSCAAPAPVFIRDEKFTLNCARARHGRLIGVFRSEAHMPTQKRETGKNYIGLLSDEIEEQRAVEVQSATDRRIKEYFLGLMAAMFDRRRSEAR